MLFSIFTSAVSGVICTKHQKESFANALKHFVELDIALLLSPRKEDSFNRSTINVDRVSFQISRNEGI